MVKKVTVPYLHEHPMCGHLEIQKLAKMTKSLGLLIVFIKLILDI